MTNRDDAGKPIRLEGRIEKSDRQTDDLGHTPDSSSVRNAPLEAKQAALDANPDKHSGSAGGKGESLTLVALQPDGTELKVAGRILSEFPVTEKDSQDQDRTEKVLRTRAESGDMTAQLLLKELTEIRNLELAPDDESRKLDKLFSKAFSVFGHEIAQEKATAGGTEGCDLFSTADLQKLAEGNEALLPYTTALSGATVEERAVIKEVASALVQKDESSKSFASGAPTVLDEAAMANGVQEITNFLKAAPVEVPSVIASLPQEGAIVSDMPRGASTEPAERKSELLAWKKGDLPPPDAGELGEYSEKWKEEPRLQCEFTQYARPYLERHEKVINEDGSVTYKVPMLGLTDRELPGHADPLVKFYRMEMLVSVPPNCSNLDKCVFSRGPREYLSEENFKAQLADLKQREDGHPISLFSHGVFYDAGKSDVDAARTAIEQGGAAINVDWRSTPSDDARKDMGERYEQDREQAELREPAFERPLDVVVNTIGAENLNVVGFSRGCFLEMLYLSHRAEFQPNVRFRSAILTHADIKQSEFKKYALSSDHQKQTLFNPFIDASNQTVFLSGKNDWALRYATTKNDHGIGKAHIETNKKLVESANGIYAKEPISGHKGSAGHFINYKRVGELINGSPLTDKEKSYHDETLVVESKRPPM